MRFRKPKLGAEPGSTSSSTTSPETPSSIDAAVLRKALDRVAQERDALAGTVEAQSTHIIGLEAELKATRESLEAGAEVRETGHEPIGPIGWLLVWNEYAYRRKEFQLDQEQLSLTLCRKEKEILVIGQYCQKKLQGMMQSIT